MKHTFVLDENIIVLAAELKDDQGRTDTSCQSLLLSILDNGHRLAISPIWQNMYYEKLSSLHNRPSLAFSVQHLLNLFVRDSDRQRWIDETIEIDMPDCVDNDDYWIVELACTVSDLFATTDDDLLDCLNDSSVTGRYRFSALGPENALTYALET